MSVSLQSLRQSSRISSDPSIQEKKSDNQLQPFQLRESLLEVKDLAFNEQILQEREAELQCTHRLSNQLKQLTEIMKHGVEEQGKMLNSIEENVEVANENAEKADAEIEEADRNFSSSNKCIKLILIGAVLVVLSIILVIILI